MYEKDNIQMLKNWTTYLFLQAYLASIKRVGNIQP